MVVLPGRNFARFVLMLYIMMCLVMRTAYQGKQFEFITKEMRRPDIKTIDEFIARQFNILVHEEYFKYHKDLDFMKR